VGHLAPITEEDRGPSTPRNIDRPDQTPTLLAKPTSRTCRVYFATILDETVPTVSNFYAAMADVVHKKSDIIWSKASVFKGPLSPSPSTQKTNLPSSTKNKMFGGKFIVVS
jgi:hypothetical protein